MMHSYVPSLTAHKFVLRYSFLSWALFRFEPSMNGHMIILHHYSHSINALINNYCLPLLIQMELW